MIFNKYILRIFLCFTGTLFLFCDTITSENKSYQLYLDKAENDFIKQNYSQAFYNYENAKISCDNDSEKDKIIYCLIQMSEIQLRQSDYAGSESSATEALSYFTDSTRLDFKTFIYNILSLNYLEEKNYEESISNYKKALSITKTEISKLIIQNNIAYNYLKQSKFYEAKNILGSIKNNDTLKNEPLEYARVLDNLGYAKFKLNDKTAIDDLIKSKKIREEKQDDVGLTATSIHLAEYYEKSDNNLAKTYALRTLKYASKVKNADDKLEALQYLTKVSKGEDSKKYAIQSFVLNNSIKTVRQEAKNQFAKIKYDSKKAIEESIKQKQLKEYFIIGIIFLFVFSFLLYYRIKKKNKKKIRETAYVTETRIAKKLHDELANDVHNTIAFAETQDLYINSNKDILLENLETIYIRARNISSENKDIDTGENYLEKLKAMIASYSSNDINVILNIASFDDKNLDKEIKITIYRVLQELMVNMKKHSHCSIVSIGFKSNKKAIEINYSDNGIGCANLLNLKNGLQNVENRIFSINGTINFDTEPEKGFKVKIMIPK